ncbi:MAG: site-2 protease family protein [Deltaproteobacteria bacterium]|nr:site-2 protease family protein [Deltaproteobacteria bacterium]
MSEADVQRPANLHLHIGLFVLTCLSTTWAGVTYIMPGADLATRWAHLADGAAFSISIMAILLTHEMGHYLLARYHKVPASLPFFIPLPFGMIGTLGAVISMRREIRDRNALIDIGAAGPLAGLLIAIPVLIYGLSISEVIVTPGGMLEGNSLLYAALKFLAKGEFLPHQETAFFWTYRVDVALSPVAWAGWVGLLVTMINLLPIGQLDGGHIAYAYFGSRQNRASQLFHRLLLPLALGCAAFSLWEVSRLLPLSIGFSVAMMSAMPWLVWWALLKLMRRMSGGVYHPPVDNGELTVGRRWLARLVFAVFIVIFAPIPMRFTIG